MTQPPIMLHLGCGTTRLTGFVNVDYQSSVNPDMVLDLQVFPWMAWNDSVVDHIYSCHVLEHMPDPIGFMSECHRILKPGGTLECVVPYPMRSLYLDDPTHVRPWTPNTVLYFVRDRAPHDYGQPAFELDYCRLEDQGLHSRGQLYRGWQNRLRNLLLPRCVRHILKEVLWGMWDEVHFQLRKPL